MENKVKMYGYYKLKHEFMKDIARIANDNTGVLPIVAIENKLRQSYPFSKDAIIKEFRFHEKLGLLKIDLDNDCIIFKDDGTKKE